MLQGFGDVAITSLDLGDTYDLSLQHRPTEAGSYSD